MHGSFYCIKRLKLQRADENGTWKRLEWAFQPGQGKLMSLSDDVYSKLFQSNLRRPSVKSTKTQKALITLIRLMFFALFVLLIHNGKMVLWLGVFAISLVAELVFGRFYCGFLCPMNTVMIPTDWLASKMKIQTNKVPSWLKSGYIAWVLLAVSLVSMILLKRLHDTNIPILSVLLVLSILMTLRFHPSVFHNLLCPFGAIQKLFSQKPLLSHRVNPQACIGCKRCEKVCPSHAIVVTVVDHKAHVSDHICHQCTNCQQVCPTSAIHYAK